MEPARKPDQPYDDEGNRPLSAQERAQQRWGMTHPDISGGSDVIDPPDLEVLDGGGETSDRRRGHLGVVGDKGADSSEKLKKKEEEAPDRSGFSAGDDMREKLGLGYTGEDSRKSGILSKLYGSSSAVKRKVAIAGAAAGGSLILGLLLFFLLLPFKIEHIVDNIENKFGAAAQNALDNETENMFDQYETKKVLPSLVQNLNKKGCTGSTIDINCTAFSSDTSTPVGKLWQSWKQGRLENKMATKYNLSVAYKNGQFYMNTSAGTINLGRANKDGTLTSIFGDANTKSATRNQIRKAVRQSLKDATRYDKIYLRFKYGRLLEAKYGIKRCLIACDIRDKFTDTVADKKRAIKGWGIQRVVSPFSQSWGIVMQCLIGGGSTCDPTPSDSRDGSGNQERLTNFQKSLQAQMDAYAEKLGANGAEKLKNLLAQADDISKNGYQKYFMAQVMSKVLGKEITSEAIDKLSDPFSWIKYGAKAVGLVDETGKLKMFGYAMKAEADTQELGILRTAAAEAKSGHVDMTELGSVADSLSTAAKDSNGNASDATDTPIYRALFENPTGNKGTYKCIDNKPVPAGKLICPEDSLTDSNATADSISKAAHAIPGWQVLEDASTVVNKVGSSNWNPANWLSELGNLAVEYTPGVNNLSGFLGGFAAKLTSPLFGLLMGALIPSSISATMSGGQTMVAAIGGADASKNADCQAELGCAEISNQQVADIRNQQVADEKQTFESQSMFARMFDTSSSYSLVSQLAMDMPTNLAGLTNTGTASVFSNPLNKVGSVFSSMFSRNRAFAAQPPQDDAFGVTQVGYTSVPSDPDQYWKDNCVSGPLATYDSSTEQLDVSNWLDQQTLDPETGQFVAKVQNPCLLIQSAVQSAGGLFDASLLPQDSTSSTAGDQTTALPTGDQKALAQQILDNKKIHFQNDSDRQDFQNTVDGKPSTCTDGAGTVTLNGGMSTALMVVMLELAKNYDYQVSASFSGHGGPNSNGCSDGGRHPLGRAIDVDAINGTVITGDACDTDACRYTGSTDLDRQFINSTITILNAVLPNGHFVGKDPVAMGGLGQMECLSPRVTVPSTINAFNDNCNHVHIDVGARDN